MQVLLKFYVKDCPGFFFICSERYTVIHTYSIHTVYYLHTVCVCRVWGTEEAPEIWINSGIEVIKDR